MRFADLVEETTTSTTTDVIVLAGAVSGFRPFSATDTFAVGATDIAVYVRAGALWEFGLYTLTDATHLTRQGAPRGSSSGGAAVTFPAGSKTVYNDVPSEYLVGTPLTDYLAANDAGAAQPTDVVPLGRGTGLFGATVSVLAAAVHKLWPGAKQDQVRVTTTASFPLDFVAHHRRLLVLKAAATITAPSSYTTVGDGFECEVLNLSGADIPLTGMLVRPSGSVVPAGASARIKGAEGALYVDLIALPAGSGAASVAPGAVTGLTAGTATATTQPLTWTAPATGTAPITYKVEYRLAGGTTWTTASASVSGTSYTVTGLTAATSYDYQVTPSNAVGAGTAQVITGKSTASPPASAPFTVTAKAGAPLSTMTFDTANNVYTNVSKTGTPTIAGVVFYLSTSNTVRPAADIGSGTTPKGKVMTTGGGGSNGGDFYTFDYPTKYGVAATTNFYFWVKVTDSDSNVWWFLRPTPILIGDNATASNSTVAEALVAA